MVPQGETHAYRVTFTFNAPKLTVWVLSWVLRAYCDLGAPAGLRVRVERLD
jgi:hypothetical protein